MKWKLFGVVATPAHSAANSFITSALLPRHVWPLDGIFCDGYWKSSRYIGVSVSGEGFIKLHPAMFERLL